MRFYKALWLTGIAATLVTGMLENAKTNRAWKLVDYGPNSSTNASLSALIGLQDGDAAQQITDWLHLLPTNRPVLIVGAPKNVAAAGAAQVISYLAWPRRVLISCNSLEDSNAEIQRFPEDYSAVVLCHLPPPRGIKNMTSFGPSLTLISAGHPQE